MINIAIDGPSGAGKSTLAKAFAKRHGFIYVDTGALYRSIGLYAKRKGISLDEIIRIVNFLSDIDVKLEYDDGNQKVILNGEDVSAYIRTPEIAKYASSVSAIPEVREFLLDIQRKIANENNVVMDGRDIGTVILPNADVKIFLSASPETRAKRRYAELLEKGENVSYEQVFADMKNRDANDSGRKIAPAIPAKDAIHFDNSDLSIDDTVDKLTKTVEEKIGHAL